MTSSFSEYTRLDLSTQLPVPIQIGPNEYTYDKTTSTYKVTMKQPLQDCLVSLNRVEFVPRYSTLTSPATGSISYNSVAYPFTVSTGSDSFTDLAAAIYNVQTANNLYLVNSTGQIVTFITLALAPSNQEATLVVNPVPSTLPGGFTNPANLALTGNTPQITFSTGLSTLLGGFPSSPYPPTVSTTSSTYTSAGVPPNIFFNYKVQMRKPVPVAQYFPQQGRPCLYQGQTAFSVDGTPVRITPFNRAWYYLANNGSENLLEFAIANQSDLPVALTNPTPIFVIDCLFKAKWT